MTDRDARLSPEFSYDALIARANAEHAEAVHHPLQVMREFVHAMADVLHHDAQVPEATAGDAYLADARSYADLRGRFNELAARHNDVPLDPGP
jgi:hypothetical protein